MASIMEHAGEEELRAEEAPPMTLEEENEYLLASLNSIDVGKWCIKQAIKHHSANNGDATIDDVIESAGKIARFLDGRHLTFKSPGESA